MPKQRSNILTGLQMLVQSLWTKERHYIVNQIPKTDADDIINNLRTRKDSAFGCKSLGTGE